MILGLWPLAVLGQEPPPKPEPAPAADTLASIKAEAESARDSLKSFFETQFRDPEKRPTGTEISAANAAHHARLLGLMDRALTLARSHPGGPEAIAAPAWVAFQMPWDHGDDITERGDAAFRLLADAPVLDDPAILTAIFGAGAIGLRCPEVEPFLRSVLSRSRSRDLAAYARYYLGAYLAELARMPDRLASPFGGPRLAKELTNDRLDRYRAIDGPRIRGEAKALLEEVARQDIELDFDPKGAAKAELFRIRYLGIGQPVPDLAGDGLDGKPIRLGDFRGKVVFLSYWATDSVPYPAEIEKMKDLVAAMKGRPFAIVGINGDAEGDRARETVAKEGITWRSLWAGGPGAPILRGWGVDGWSTAYTIDAEGIIRDDRFGELSPDAFEPLVRAAEKAGR